MSARWILRSLIIFLVIAFQLAALVMPASAAVTLVAFEAFGDLGAVLLIWETATELDNAGFYIRRSSSQNGTYTRVSPFVPSEGDPLVGAIYFWEDDDVVDGTTYWYKLEAIDLNQNSEFHGPISAIPGDIQPTVTRSPTPTRIITITPGGPTASPTVSRTPAPTPTRTRTPVTAARTRTPTSAYPAPATITRVAPVVTVATSTSQFPSPTVGSTVVPPITVLPNAPISGTATLLPLPGITLTFPEGGIILPGSNTATWTVTPIASNAGTSRWYPWGGIILVVVLVLIWGILGTWLYFSFRRV